MRWTAVLISAAMMFPVVALAGGPAAHVSTTGTVRTNSSLLPSGSTIYAGDLIATGGDGLAVVTSPEIGRLEVRPSSRVEFALNRVMLRDGAVAAGKAAVALGEYTIKARTPESPDNWFAVVSKNGRKVVAAHRGDVVIARAGVAPVLVPAGSYAVAGQAEGKKTENSEPADAKPEDQQSDENQITKEDEDDDDDGAAAVIGKSAGDTAAQAPASEGWTIGSLSHQGNVILVTTIGAAAATGTALGFALSDKPVSPSR